MWRRGQLRRQYISHETNRLLYRKGKMLKFIYQDVDSFIQGNLNELDYIDGNPGKSCLFFLTGGKT